MPIKIPSGLPARDILDSERIFALEKPEAERQRVRPLKLVILNLMPKKIETETQLLRLISKSPLQVEIDFMKTSTHEATHVSADHLVKFYETLDAFKDNYYDGLVVTGAPVEHLDFEQVDYWDEFCEIVDWSQEHVFSTMFLCWGAQASLYHFYGLKKRMLPEKKFGLFWHKVNNRKIPLVRGFDDEFLAPHSRHTEVPIDDIRACKDVTILAESDEAGFYLGMAEEGRKIFVMGHPEYDRMTLDGEYHRDKDKGLPIEIPKNYYKNDDPNTKPVLLWRSHANNLYTNWLNYYVYQVTPYNLDGTPDFSGK